LPNEVRDTEVSIAAAFAAQVGLPRKDAAFGHAGQGSVIRRPSSQLRRALIAIIAIKKLPNSYCRLLADGTDRGWKKDADDCRTVTKTARANRGGCSKGLGRAIPSGQAVIST
jgi:hypothetical protein